MEREGDRGLYFAVLLFKRFRGKIGESKEDLGEEMNEFREKNNRIG